MNRYELSLRHWGIAVASAVALFLSPITAIGQGTPEGSEFLVNTYTSNGQSYPAIGMDNDGDFVISWVSMGQDGHSEGVFAQRYNSAGIPQGSEFQVNTYTNNYQSYPDIAMDSDGDFVICWMSHSQDGATTWGIYAQRYDSAGVAQGGELQVTNSRPYADWYPAIAMDNDGNFVITWAATDEDGLGIFVKRYDSSGILQGGEFQVNTYTKGNQTNPDIAMDSEGNFVITWQSYEQDGSYYGVYAQRYNSAGIPQGSEFRVNTHTIDYQTRPAIAMDNDGDFVITWESKDQDGSDYGVYAQRYNSAGIPQGSEFQVNTYTIENQSEPAIAMDSDGDFVITWQSDDNQDGFAHGVFAQRYNHAGAAQGSEFQVNTYTYNTQYRPAIAINNDGTFLIIWESVGQVNGGLNGDIYAQSYSSSIVSSVQPAVNNAEVRIFPNPVKDELTITGGKGNATIYNMHGQPVRDFSINNWRCSIDVRDLPNGHYILRITNQNGNVISQQFVR